MIEIQNLTKRYGNKVAVNNISFTVNSGEIVGFLGRNGAGKSTTMNMLTGYISSTAGTAKVEGYDILEQPMEVKKRIGYLPEQPPLYMDMTVDEYLNFVAELKGVQKKNRKEHLDEVKETVHITDVRHRIVGNLSKGYKQRVGLAQALVNNPPVLILDEPTVGLDPNQIIEIRRLIKTLGKKHTVILSSHILPEVADVCEKVVIIDRGNIVAQDTLANLQSGLGSSTTLCVRIAGGESKALRMCRELEGVVSAESLGVRESDTVDILITTRKDTDIRRVLFNTAAKAGMPILLCRYMDITLEDIFLQLTGSDRDER
ncbi:MAG: ATP-binding cassette domain-containing protein [Clostridiales bacterium]|nr:ATP-binding cassette domain-containing protein [Clostridiales bacterium]